VPRPASRTRADPVAALQDEVHELRLAVAALRAEITQLHERPPVQVVVADATAAAIEPAALTLLLPLARAAQQAGLPADGVLSLDLGHDTAETEIVLTTRSEAPPAVSAPSTSGLPEAPLLDPRLARVAGALDDLLEDETTDERVGAGQRETA
jgi:hypothetical protein